MTLACGNNGLCSERLCRRQYVWQQQIVLSVFPQCILFSERPHGIEFKALRFESKGLLG